MPRSEPTQPILDYLRRLDAALIDVSPATAQEIRSGVLEELASLEPAELPAKLAQLGDPEFIAAEARAEAPAQPERRRSGLASRGYIVLASLSVAIGIFVVPVAGWIAGYVLVWVSPAWRRWEKAVATTVPMALALATAVYFSIDELQRRASTGLPSDNPLLPLGPIGLVNAMFVFALGNLAVGVWLMIRALRRT